MSSSTAAAPTPDSSASASAPVDVAAGAAAPAPVIIDPPLCTTTTWFGRCAVAFKALHDASPDGGAALPIDAATACSTLMAESYGYMFGAGGVVTGILNKDLEANTGGVARAAKKHIDAARAAGKPLPLTLQDIFAAELAEKGLSKARYDKKGGLCCGLWMARALLFCARFGARLISSGGASPSECARSVYDEVLRPYHGFIVSNVVSMAFGLAPSRSDFFKRVGADEVQMRGELDAFVKYVGPAVEGLHAWFVSSGYNFPDKA